MKKYLILIFGPMCSGKSTLIKLYQKKTPEVFHASMDNIKWFVSDYSTNKYGGLGTINRILFAMNNQVASENLSLIIEGSTGLMKYARRYEKLAKKNGMTLVKINLEAPYGILKKRFYIKVNDAKRKNIKISINKEKDLLHRFNEYNNYRDKTLYTLDSSKLNPKKILHELEKIIRQQQ